jgi:hypothetical protein
MTVTPPLLMAGLLLGSAPGAAQQNSVAPESLSIPGLDGRRRFHRLRLVGAGGAQQGSAEDDGAEEW